MTEPDLEIREEALSSPIVAELIGELNEELARLYPEEGANHFRLDVDEVTSGRGAFLVAYSGGKSVGCGAVRRNDATTGEIKRMYVRPAARGRGVGRRILRELQREARSLGVSRLVLETGNRQPEAIGLYAGAGFKRIPLFGEYLASPLTSVCMEKAL